MSSSDERRIWRSSPPTPTPVRPLSPLAGEESKRRGGRSTTECRDPFPYLTTNEPRGYIWDGYVRDLGGGYIGVGSDHRQEPAVLQQFNKKFAFSSCPAPVPALKLIP